MYGLRKLFYPEIFQGKYKKSKYFEGWYYKLIDETMEHAIAIIPGIAIGKNREDAHAFIQVLYNGRQVAYYRYPFRDFRYHRKKFAIKIGQNYFSKSRLYLKIGDESMQGNTARQNHKGRDSDALKLSGSLCFRDIISLPKSLFLPGIMGPFTYIPYMECYHGIINIHHRICGKLKVEDRVVDFTGGYGYIEKDWGRSFPKSWVWVQSNHFDNRDATIMLSAARIPWLGGSFLGFLSFLRLGDELYLFATYTGAKLIRLAYVQGCLRASIRDRKYRLELWVTQAQGGGELKAPSMGRMERTIIESIHSVIRVHLYRRSGELIYEGTGRNAGFELVKE